MPLLIWIAPSMLCKLITLCLHFLQWRYGEEDCKNLSLATQYVALPLLLPNACKIVEITATRRTGPLRLSEEPQLVLSRPSASSFVFCSPGRWMPSLY